MLVGRSQLGIKDVRVRMFLVDYLVGSESKSGFLSERARTDFHVLDYYDVLSIDVSYRSLQLPLDSLEIDSSLVMTRTDSS